MRFYETANRGNIAAGLDVIRTTLDRRDFRDASKRNARADRTAVRELATGIWSTVEDLIAEDEHVVALVRGEAKTEDGKPYNNWYCHVFRIVGGCITEVTEYLDTVLATIGASFAPVPGLLGSPHFNDSRSKPEVDARLSTHKSQPPPVELPRRSQYLATLPPMTRVPSPNQGGPS